MEFAFIAALLLAIIFGILEYSLIFLQEHYVANAAREGARIGIRANRYICYNSVNLPGQTETCVDEADRLVVIKNAVADYLSRIYDTTDAINGTSVEIRDLGLAETPDPDPILVVSVQMDRLFTSITPALLNILKAGTVEYPDKISFSVVMELEDASEYEEP